MPLQIIPESGKVVSHIELIPEPTESRSVSCETTLVSPVEFDLTSSLTDIPEKLLPKRVPKWEGFFVW
ncbi:hypothetical protein N9D38_07055 [Rubripirellula sp.]|nr:hypothetical protein [Rubripirellula sp.]